VWNGHLTTTFVGIDGDWSILRKARAKPENHDNPVAWHCGTVDALPYADATFDIVFSSLLFHHLTYQMKLQAFREILRLLRPGGQMYLGDWGPPPNLMMRLLFVPVQLLDGFLTTQDNVRGVLPLLMEEVGFTAVHKTAAFATPLGMLTCYTGQKPH
jgi:SAM-dependent methyltransferase